MLQEDAQLIQEFVAEAFEHLAVVESQLLALEDPTDPANPERINDVFRAVHTVKGVSAFLGLDTINSLAHHLENCLNQMRHSSSAPSSGAIEVVLRSADKMRRLVENIEASNGVDIQTEIKELAVLLQQMTGAEPAVATTLEQVEQLVAQIESPTQATPNSAALPAVDKPMEAAAVAVNRQPVPSKQSTPAAPTVPSANAGLPVAHSDHETPAVTAARGNHAAAELNVRVPVAILERLMNLAGELVLSRNQLLRVVATRRKTGIETISSRLDQVTSELQEAIMCARMQQIGTVFNRFPRLVRDLCKKLNKQCQLIVEGSEVELDKTILEAVADPLTHLLRNSLDHGIETPAKRSAAGKPLAGTLVLRAFHQAGKVNITLSDDGAGINRARVLEKAVSKGIITAVQAAGMADRDVIGLLFAPGFSTAEVVTDVSGRGVGMDVVKTNIEKIGGTVEIESTAGQGTEVRVSLPLTLAIIPSLIVCDNGVRLALPETSITEIVRITPNDPTLRVERLQRAEVLRLRGELVPLVRLGSLLKTHASGQKQPATLKPPHGKKLRSQAAARSRETELTPPENVIIVESGAVKFALAVDQVRDPEQIVVKPLGRHLHHCRFLAGTTVLGDGKIGFILDVVGLAALAKLSTTSPAGGNHRVDDAPGQTAETQTTLLFRNEQHELLGVPMAMISRIERIEGGQIQTIDGRLLLMYRGSCLPLLSLAGTQVAEMCCSQGDCYVLVFRIDDREVGLIVPHLVDIRDVSLQVSPPLFTASSVMGTILLDGEIARLLDPVELVATSSLDAAAPASRQTAAKALKLVLLAEDSDFLRAQVKRFLESDDYRVVAFENGEKAWTELETGRIVPDLVVTDIEMPKMDGFEFCRRIRALQRWKNLPVVALTSLSAEEHVQHGREVGFSDYQVKMDRERLSASVRKLLL